MGKKGVLPETETPSNQGAARQKLAPVVHAISFVRAIEALTKDGKTPEEARMDRGLTEREIYTDIQEKNALQSKLHVMNSECEKLRAALYVEKKEKRLVLN